MDAGTDAILLGAETLRGLYPIETISIVGKICAEVNYLDISIESSVACLIFLLTSICNYVQPR